MTDYKIMECTICGHIAIKKTILRNSRYFCGHCKRKTIVPMDDVLRTLRPQYEQNTVSQVVGKTKKGVLRIGKERAMNRKNEQEHDQRKM